jgi:hypothetical protein
VTLRQTLAYLRVWIRHPGRHTYLSTGCRHDQHGYCSNVDGIAGLKKPAQCKFCQAPCICPCHPTTET